MKDISILLARIFIVAVFLFSFIQKALNFDGTVAYMKEIGVPSTTFLLVMALLALLAGCLSLLLGYRVKTGTLILIIFLIPTSFIFHPPFNGSPEAIQFLKNLGLIGGLMLLSANGPGKYSIRGR